MPEWIIERGIGEIRAAMIDGGQIVTAMVERDSDRLRPGAVVDARLANKALHLAVTAAGEEIYLPRWPMAAEGATVRLLIRRSAITERDLVKRATAVLADPDTPLDDGPDLAARIAATGIATRAPGFGEDALDAAGWHALIDNAASGIVTFPGGLLRICLTPAMTVIDVDGDAPGTTLAAAAVAASAAAMQRFGIGGNVVIDLPTMPDVTGRKAVAEAFDSAMATTGLRFERTAINGFGLLQIILPRERPSLLERVQFAPVETAALALLHQAKRAVGTGTLTLSAHPAVTQWIAVRPALLAELNRRTGRPAVLHADAARAMGAGHAQ